MIEMLGSTGRDIKRAFTSSHHTFPFLKSDGFGLVDKYLCVADVDVANALPAVFKMLANSLAT